MWKTLKLAAIFATVAGAAYALTNPPTFGPRQFASQQTHYIRIDAKFNAINGQPCALSTATLRCSVKVGAVPYNSYFVRGYMQIITNFNATATDLLGIGLSSTGADIVASVTVHSGAGDQAALTLVSTGSGIQHTGNGTAQTGADGGFDIWVHYNYTGAAVATAGQAIIILEYFAPNDGDCVAVPMGSTGTAC